MTNRDRLARRRQFVHDVYDIPEPVAIDTDKEENDWATAPVVKKPGRPRKE